MSSVTILSPLTIATMSAMVGMALADDHRNSLRESADRAAEAIREARENSSSNNDDKRQHYESERESLRDELASEISKLGRHPSREEVDRVVEDFKREHEATLAEQKSLANELSKDAVDDARLDAVTEFRRDRGKAEEDRRRSREHFHENVSAANSQEQREEIRHAFREDQRARHHEMKSALQSLLREVRGGDQRGSRRTAAP